MPLTVSFDSIDSIRWSLRSLGRLIDWAWDYQFYL